MRFHSSVAGLPVAGAALVALAVGVLTPWLVNAVLVANDLQGFDPAPVALAVSAVVFAWTLFRLRRLDIVPVARRAMLESLPVGTMALDHEGRVVDLNPAARRALALAGRPGEAVGRNIGDLLDAWPELAARLRHEAAGTMHVPLGRGAEQRHYELAWSPLRGERGRTAGQLLLWRDVTERWRAETALRDQKTLFENLVAVAQATAQRPSLEATLQNSLDVAVSLTGAEGASLFLLDAAGLVERCLYSKSLAPAVDGERHATRVVSRGLAGWVARARTPVLVADTDRDPRWIPLDTAEQDLVVRSALSTPITAGESVLGVLTLTHSEQAYFSEGHLRFVQAAAAQMGLALRNARMFERQCELADKLAREHERLEELQQARDDLTNALVHDLRNPLTSVRGALEYLRTTMSGAGAAQREMLDVAEHSAERMSHLTDSILTVSRLESGSLPIEPAWIGLPALVEDALAQQRPLAQHKGLTLESRVPQATPLVWADPSLLARVLQNLIGNAIQATPNGGRVVVRLDEQQAAQLRLAVCDTGPGIPATIRSRLFGKFVSATPGGSGLGLAFCRLAVEAMGGRLWLASETGESATFVFSLPLRPRVIPQEDALYGE